MSGMQVWDKVTQKSGVRNLQDMRGTYNRAGAFLPYVINLCTDDTCAVQAEAGDSGYAADGNASASRGLSGF